MAGRRFILILNGGSSSLKFVLFTAEPAPQRVCKGRIERIGQPGSVLETQRTGKAPERRPVEPGDWPGAIGALLAWLAEQPERDALAAAGHRIVHGGGRFAEPCVLTAEICAELRQLAPLNPEHLPMEIALVEAVARARPGLPQIACFDTVFHRSLPRIAQLLPLPRRYYDAGLRRYGFHGLSYTFLLDELQRTAGPEVARGRLLLAHLGSGVSLAAVAGGRCMDTTMSFTPASGVPMGTRSGDLDPGITGYLARTAGMGVEAFGNLVNRESGLLGMSGSSADVRDLLARAGTDARAEEAIAVFCYEIRKCIGALAAALGGLDGLVFTGGIGENASLIRTRICDGLGFLGIQIDAARNAANATVISAEGAPVTVRVIRTDEERVIAEAVVRLLVTHRGQEGPTP